MARPKGSKNTRLSRQERRDLVEQLRRQADAGDVLASVALLNLGTVSSAHKRQGKGNDERTV